MIDTNAPAVPAAPADVPAPPARRLYAWAIEYGQDNKMFLDADRHDKFDADDAAVRFHGVIVELYT